MAPRLVGVRLRTEKAGWLVHPDLRNRMIEDAREQGTNLGAVAVKILSDRFGVAYDPKDALRSRQSAPGPDSEQFNFHLPPDLERRIASVYPGAKMNDGIRYTLCAHYGLAIPAKPKFTRNRKPRPAAA